ncbi:MAG TPA: TonB-dependent receptor [Caulobacteraceae bacterium]|nr:TonB-dependent receptor [Caulobacteraceae bacterium]
MSLVFIMAAAVAAAPAPSAVTSYPAAFFAASSPTNALEMVQRLPGFTFDSGAAVRGFGGAAGNVLIDGVRPAAKDDTIDQVLFRIPATSVDRIEVIRGGAPDIDMQGKTILANVIRKAGGGTKLLIAGAIDHAWDGRIGGAARFEVSTRIGATNIEGALSAGRGFDDGSGSGPRTLTDGDAVIAKAFEKSAGTGENYKATLATETPVAGGKLRLNASLSSNPYDYTQDDAFISPPGHEFERDHQGQVTAETGLRYEHPIGAKASVETYLLQQLGWSNFTADFTSDPVTAAITGNPTTEFFSLKKTSGESIARVTFKYQTGPKLGFQAGGEGDFNWLQDHTLLTEDGAPTAVPAANVRVTETRGEAFATATWQARKSLILEAGVRVEASRIGSTGDVVDQRGFVYPKPRVAVTWSPDDADQLRLRVEREVGQLNFDDFAASTASVGNGGVHAGNPNLDPQTDWVAEAAFDRRFWGSADATVTVRHYALHNVIDRVPILDPAGDYDAPGNIGPGTKDEIAFSLTLPTDRLGIKNGLLTGQATRRWSRVIDPLTGLPRPISALHALDGELHFAQGLTRWKTTWGFDIFDQWRETRYLFDEIDTDKLKIFVGLFAEYKPKVDLSFRFELNDATGHGFEHSRDVYNGLRNAGDFAYTDRRDLHTGRELHFRVLKTFG